MTHKVTEDIFYVPLLVTVHIILPVRLLADEQAGR